MTEVYRRKGETEKKGVGGDTVRGCAVRIGENERVVKGALDTWGRRSRWNR